MQYMTKKLGLIDFVFFVAKKKKHEMKIYIAHQN